MAGVLCNECGTVNGTSTKFCIECGTAISGRAETHDSGCRPSALHLRVCVIDVLP